MDYDNTGPILPASLADSVENLDELSVLYIEDDIQCFQLVQKQLLASSGDVLPFRLYHASSLQEGLHFLQESRSRKNDKFDVILLDLNLPDSVGEDTFFAISESDNNIPIIVLSGENEPGVALKLVRKGAQDFLPKSLLEIPEAVARSIYSAVERSRILTEKNLLQSQLIQAEKLDSLGRIAAGVAHEVKNPLAIIQMGIAYLNARIGEIESSERAEILGACREVQEAANRAVKIIGGMVDFSRDDSVSLVKADVNQVVARSLELLKYDITKNSVVLTNNLSSSLPPVLLDESKIQQVLINILRNSVQAMKETGAKGIQIRTYSTPIPSLLHVPALQRVIGKARDGEIVTIEVRDEGPGIPEDKLSQIFEPFFTTKSKGKGSGLGLSVVFHIIDLHNGAIRVKNMSDPPGLRTRIHLKAMRS